MAGDEVSAGRVAERYGVRRVDRELFGLRFRCESEGPCFASGASQNALAFGWRSGLPLRFRRSIPTASAAAGLYPVPIRALPNCTDTLLEWRPDISSPDSDECIGGTRNIPPSHGLGDHGNSSPISLHESRVPSWRGMNSRL